MIMDLGAIMDKPTLIKFQKTHPEAKVPTYATPGAAAVDLTSVSRRETEHYIEYDTGLAMELPEGFVGLLAPRSSISNKIDLSLANSVGIIDSDFRGSIKVRFRGNNSDIYEIGERCAQLMILELPRTRIVEVDQLSDTKRGQGGFGSSGS